MNRILYATVALSVFLILANSGCGHKTADNKAQINQATQDMVKAGQNQPMTMTAPGAVSAPSNVQQMNDALASYKSGDLEDAVTRFQVMRAHTSMSGEELIALNNAMAAVMGDIYARAAKGDVRAQQAVREYQRLQQNRQKWFIQVIPRHPGFSDEFVRWNVLEGLVLV